MHLKRSMRLNLICTSAKTRLYGISPVFGQYNVQMCVDNGAQLVQRRKLPVMTAEAALATHKHPVANIRTISVKVVSDLIFDTLTKTHRNQQALAESRSQQLYIIHNIAVELLQTHGNRPDPTPSLCLQTKMVADNGANGCFLHVPHF